MRWHTKGFLCCYLICLTLKWTVGAAPSPLVASVSSSLLVGTVVSRLLWAIVRGWHQRLFFWLIIKWRTDKRLSSDPSCGTESMRRLSGRIKWRTSLCLQSLMDARCLCSGRERKRKSALCITGQECEPVMLREPDSIYSNGQGLSLRWYCQSLLYSFVWLTKHSVCATSFFPFENLSIIFVSLRQPKLMMTLGTECMGADRLTVYRPGVLCCVNDINCAVTTIYLQPVVLSILHWQYR